MDYRKIAAEELLHINALRTAEFVCRDRLSELNDSLRALKTSSPQNEPVQGGGTRTDDRWLNLISAKSDEEMRLRNIRRQLKRFDTAWTALSERDQSVLTVFYIVNSPGVAERFSENEHCDRSTAYRWRDEALIQFTRAMYGEVIT